MIVGSAVGNSVGCVVCVAIWTKKTVRTRAYAKYAMC